MSEKINQELNKLISGFDSLSGYATSTRQKQEYASEYWHRLVGLCCQLLEEIRFAPKSNAGSIDSDVRLGGEAFAAGISGACPDCEEVAELQSALSECEKERKLNAIAVVAITEEMDTRNMASSKALDELWKEIILKNKPNYGDWEYPMQAKRHIVCEFVDKSETIDELVKALAEHGCHKGWCKANFHEDDDECDCGLTEVLKKAGEK